MKILVERRLKSILQELNFKKVYYWFKKIQRKPNKYWNYERCYNEAEKYNTKNEFQKGNESAYKSALKNHWLDDYKWFKDGCLLSAIKRTKWTQQSCYEEAQKYDTRSAFEKGNGSAYQVALKNNWLDDYGWLIDGKTKLFTDKIDSVYVYLFKEYSTAYVGRTINIKERDRQHIYTKTDAVAKFAYEHNISIPDPIILESNLTVEQGLEREDYWLNQYKDQGYYMLNKAKTGKGCGALGTINSGKWNKESCYNEAKKYKTKIEFKKSNQRAYQVSLLNNWISEYDWLVDGNKLAAIKRTKWNKDACYQESKKYKTRSEFKKGNQYVYTVSCKNKWIDEFFN